MGYTAITGNIVESSSGTTVNVAIYIIIFIFVLIGGGGGGWYIWLKTFILPLFVEFAIKIFMASFKCCHGKNEENHCTTNGQG